MSQTYNERPGSIDNAAVEGVFDGELQVDWPSAHSFPAPELFHRKN
jgi:hypothetical protein